MSSIQTRLAFEALRSVAASSFDGTYKTLGAVMAHPIRIFKITNNSNVDVTVSFDGGTTDHEYVPAGSFLLLDVSSDRVAQCEFVLAKGTQVSVKGSAGTGSVYLSTYYAT